MSPPSVCRSDERDGEPRPPESEPPRPLQHRWWHDAIAGTFYAVAVDERGQITSAWMQDAGTQWLALDDFEPLRLADERGEIHRNDDPDGFTDELGPSVLMH